MSFTTRQAAAKESAGPEKNHGSLARERRLYEIGRFQRPNDQVRMILWIGSNP